MYLPGHLLLHWTKHLYRDQHVNKLNVMETKLLKSILLSWIMILLAFLGWILGIGLQFFSLVFYPLIVVISLIFWWQRGFTIPSFLKSWKGLGVTLTLIFLILILSIITVSSVHNLIGDNPFHLMMMQKITHFKAYDLNFFGTVRGHFAKFQYSLPLFHFVYSLVGEFVQLSIEVTTLYLPTLTILLGAFFVYLLLKALHFQRLTRIIGLVYYLYICFHWGAMPLFSQQRFTIPNYFADVVMVPLSILLLILAFESREKLRIDLIIFFSLVATSTYLIHGSQFVYIIILAGLYFFLSLFLHLKENKILLKKMGIILLSIIILLIPTYLFMYSQIKGINRTDVSVLSGGTFRIQCTNLVRSGQKGLPRVITIKESDFLFVINPYIMIHKWQLIAYLAGIVLNISVLLGWFKKDLKFFSAYNAWMLTLIIPAFGIGVNYVLGNLFSYVTLWRVAGIVPVYLGVAFLYEHLIPNVQQRSIPRKLEILGLLSLLVLILGFYDPLDYSVKELLLIPLIYGIIFVIVFIKLMFSKTHWPAKRGQ